MTDNLESDQEGLVPSGKRELSTVRPDLFRRGLELAVNLEKGARTVSFPKDRSVGKVYVTSRQCTKYESLGEAQGTISVSAGDDLNLSISEYYPGDLSSLAALKPGDLDGLEIFNDHVDDRELTYLRGLTRLRELCFFHCWKITDDGLLHLRGLNALQSVRIAGSHAEGSRIGDSGLAHLQVLPALRDLTLTNTQVTSAGLSILQNFPSLRSCSLGYTDMIGDAGLVHIGRLTKLEQLSLRWTKISDAGLSHLRKMTGLWLLNLTRTAVSDAGLEYLKDLKNLKVLDLTATSVTDAGLSRIKNYLPDCEIVKGEGPES